LLEAEFIFGPTALADGLTDTDETALLTSLAAFPLKVEFPRSSLENPPPLSAAD
jgi:hypothetical protein